MNKLHLALALVTSLVAVPASAQSFNGPSVGAQLGWANSKVGRTSINDIPLELRASKGAAVGGLFAGYDHQFGQHIVLGVEAGISAGIKDAVKRVESGATTIVDPKRTIDVTGRAGFLLDENTLVYARGGYSTVRATISQAGKDGVLRDNANLQGWTAGAGIERVFAGNLSARAEYRYADLSKDSASLKRHQVMLGLAYRF